MKDPLFKNSYFIILSTYINTILGFVFWIIVARYYSPTDVGLATIIFSGSSLVISLSNLGLNYGLIGYLSNEKNKSTMINSSLTLSTILTFILSTIFILGIEIWAPSLSIIKENFIYILYFLIFTIIFNVFTLQNYVFIALREAKISLIQNVLLNVVKLIIPLFLISFGVFGILSSWFLGYIISFSFGAVVLGRFVYKYRPVPTLNFAPIKKMIIFSFGNNISGILGSLPIQILPLMISNILSVSDVAYFYIAYSISNVVLMIGAAITTSLFTEGSYETLNLRNNVIKSSKLIIVFLVPSIVLLIVFGREILLLFGQEYSKNAYNLLWLLSISSIPNAIFQVYATIMRIKKDIMPIINLTVLMALLSITLSYILLNTMGLNGVGFAWIISWTILMIIIIVDSRQKGWLTKD